MHIDKEAAGIESAASLHAAVVTAARTNQRGALVPMRPQELADLLTAAFIAGSCHARRLAVVELDDTLARARRAGGV